MFEAQMCTLLYYSTDKCTGQWHCGSTLKDGLPDPGGSLANIIPPCAIEQPIKSFDKRTTIHNICQTKHQTHSNFCIFKFCVYLISYTTLFYKNKSLQNFYLMVYLLQ